MINVDLGQVATYQSINLSTFALIIRWKCLWRNVKFANKNFNWGIYCSGGTAQWLEFWCQLSSFSTAVVTLRGLLSISRKRCRGVAINFATRCWSSFLIQRDAPTLVEPLDVMLLLRSCTISSCSQNKMWLTTYRWCSTGTWSIPRGCWSLSKSVVNPI